MGHISVRHRRSIRTLSFAKTHSLLECLVPATNVYLAGWFCGKMHIPKMLMVLYWPPAAHVNPFFVEQSAAAAHNNNHLDYLKQITF